MIQDIAPHNYDNAYKPAPPEKSSFALYYEGRTALMSRTEEGITFPTFADLERQNDDIYEDYTYLFTIDDSAFYLVTEINRERLSEFTMENVEIFRTAQPRYLAFAGITGLQLNNWYRNHKYCGRCGKMMKKDTKERMLFCDSCHNMEYPKICPATIIGVTHGNRILMSKYAGRTYKNYALLAGFVEIGETVEETVKREVMEEVGLKVKNIRYFKSQPWSFSDTLLMGYFAELDGAEDITLDREELALAEWFEREDIPVTKTDDSLTNEMIMTFKDGKI
ncbi:MAG: NAD(+) diphosphatase [Hespellia sp.]|nr:NAD(+) diphosphatase [Hespellia sp.]